MKRRMILCLVAGFITVGIQAQTITLPTKKTVKTQVDQEETKPDKKESTKSESRTKYETPTLTSKDRRRISREADEAWEALTRPTLDKKMSDVGGDEMAIFKRFATRK